MESRDEKFIHEIFHIIAQEQGVDFVAKVIEQWEILKIKNNLKEKIPKFVKFLGTEGFEKVKEYVIMPSGDFVIKTEEGESFWFDENGKHLKSYLIFEGEQING